MHSTKLLPATAAVAAVAVWFNAQTPQRRRGSMAMISAAW
jgi:hypothetical protein